MKVNVIRPEDRPTYIGEGRLTKVLLEPSDGVDSFSCVRVLFPPGERSEPHAKPATTEVVITQRGTLTLISGGGQYSLPAGAVVIIEPGTEHVHANLTGDPVEILVLLTPPGPEQVFKGRQPLSEIQHDSAKIT